MVHVAKEMGKAGFTQPLLIGGATTSPAHTAIKIAPHYPNSVIHVLDASRSVPVVSALLSEDLKENYIRENEERHVRLRKEFAERNAAKNLISFATAKQRGLQIDWATADLPQPEFLGIREIEPSLEELVPFIDWSPFFHTWELRGRFPAIFEDKYVGEEAKKLYDESQKLLARIVAEKVFTARGVYGFFPANRVGEDIVLYTGEDREKVLTTFHCLRQQMQKSDAPNYSLADFIAPRESGRADYLGGFVVTAGHGVDEFARSFREQHDDYNGIMAQALADRLVEAFAEFLHKRVRQEWIYGLREEWTIDDLIRERYRGIRPAGGYPASPDHTEKTTLFDLLDATARTGVRLTEGMAMHPGASVSGLYFANEVSRYFAVGQINRDQVEDYARRKGMEVAEVERWLAPNLAH